MLTYLSFLQNFECIETFIGDSFIRLSQELQIPYEDNVTIEEKLGRIVEDNDVEVGIGRGFADIEAEKATDGTGNRNYNNNNNYNDSIARQPNQVKNLIFEKDYLIQGIIASIIFVCFTAHHYRRFTNDNNSNWKCK